MVVERNNVEITDPAPFPIKAKYRNAGVVKSVKGRRSENAGKPKAKHLPDGCRHSWRDKKYNRKRGW